jgi:hypothetical protein
MSLNPIKAEKNLEFKNKSYKARMSLDTILRVEEAVGCSILKLGQKLATGDLTTSETINVLHLCIRAGGNDVSINEIKEHVSGVGLVEAIKMTGELLTVALSTEDTEPSEKKSND